MAHVHGIVFPELKKLFVQVLLLAQKVGLVQRGRISLDGTKIHADASKSKAVSHKRLGALEVWLRAAVEELFALAEQDMLSEELDVAAQIARR